MELSILFIFLATTYTMVIAKRLSALIRNFRQQSFFLFLLTFTMALREKSLELFAISALLFTLKVVAIPTFLSRITRRIKTDENLGLFMNTQLSLVSLLVLTYLSWVFAKSALFVAGERQSLMLTISFAGILAGIFLMIFRMKALAQIIGLLVMENGIFLLASVMAGGMPFFVEIAIFFDVLVSVIILGAFVYRINRLFTHIDVSKLSHLRG